MPLRVDVEASHGGLGEARQTSRPCAVARWRSSATPAMQTRTAHTRRNCCPGFVGVHKARVFLQGCRQELLASSKSLPRGSETCRVRLSRSAVNQLPVVFLCLVLLAAAAVHSAQCEASRCSVSEAPLFEAPFSTCMCAEAATSLSLEWLLLPRVWHG
jgi:hypothetical protein